ncbi:MAG: translesion error-prone DNA polymerase V autoproteolytic subunit [Desulfovibrio sp.]|nr:translesion error-prone DNA polymerase V autoproteolytic subunit [Desulfovibrio sp.]
MIHSFQQTEPEVKVEFLGTAVELKDITETLPIYLNPVQAGFPTPAGDDVDERLNLHTHLVKHESATFFLRASGNSMINAGIHDGDLLIVDRAVEAAHNKIVIAALEGELTVKRLVRRGNKVFLAPANPDYPEFDITHREHIHIWGVVTYAIHKL